MFQTLAALFRRPTRRDHGRRVTATPGQTSPGDAPGLYRRHGLTPCAIAFVGSRGECCLLVALAIDRGMTAATLLDLFGEDDDPRYLALAVSAVAAGIGLSAGYAHGLCRGWDEPGAAIDADGDFADGLRDGRGARIACEAAGMFEG